MLRHAAACVAFAALAAGCGQGGNKSSNSTPPDNVRTAVASASCYEPQYGFGLAPRRPCARVEGLTQLGNGVWRLQLRIPEAVYCVELQPGVAFADGGLIEVRCPPSTYGHRREPALKVRLVTVYKTRGTATLSADGTKTRVVIEADLDSAWIRKGRCPNDLTTASHPELTATPLQRLRPFYSFRSDTLLSTQLTSLLRTPHMLLVDAGGAHGGDPIGCVDLQR